MGPGSLAPNNPPPPSPRAAEGLCPSGEVVEVCPQLVGMQGNAGGLGAPGTPPVSSLAQHFGPKGCPVQSTGGRPAAPGTSPLPAPGRGAGIRVMDRGSGAGAGLVPAGRVEKGRNPVLEGSLPSKRLGRGSPRWNQTQK